MLDMDPNAIFIKLPQQDDTVEYTDRRLIITVQQQDPIIFTDIRSLEDDQFGIQTYYGMATITFTGFGMYY